MSEEGKLDPELEALLSAEPPPAETEAETNGVAEPARRPIPASVRRRGRGKDKAPRVMGRPLPTPEAGDAARAGAMAVEPQSVPPLTDFEGSRDALVVWPKVLDIVTRVDGFTADQISIRVTRVPVGSVELSKVRSQTSELIPLVGSDVAGDETLSPAEALYYCILNQYHSTYTGPAIYKLTFQYRFGKSGNIPGVPANVELKLEHPNVIRSQMEAKERKAYEESIRSGRPVVPARTPYGHPYYPPTSAPQPQQVQPAPNLSNPNEVELLRRLAGENGYYKGLLEGRAEAPPAAAAATPPPRDPRLPPEGMTAEEWDAVLAQRQAKAIGPAIVQTMMAMGLTPELLQSLRVMAQQQSGAPAGQAPLPVAAATPSDPLAGFKSLIGMMDDLGKMKKNLAKAFGVEIPEDGAPGAEKEEDPTQMKPVLGGVVFPGTDQPMSFGSKLEDESWPEYIVRLGTHNPAMAMAALEKIAKVLDPKVLSGLVETLVAKGAAAPPKQVGAAPAAAPQPAGEPPKKGWQPT